MRQEFLEEIKRYVWKDNTLWARGYYIASVADSVTTEVIREYINSQKTTEKKPQKDSVSGYHQPNLL